MASSLVVDRELGVEAFWANAFQGSSLQFFVIEVRVFRIPEFKFFKKPKILLCAVLP